MEVCLDNIKNIRIKLPAKASVWYLGVAFASKAVGFLITPFFTRAIDGEAYGELTLYLTMVGIGSVCCSAFNTGGAFFKEMKNNEEEKGSFLKSALLVSLIASSVFCLLLFTLRPFIALPSHLLLPLFLQIICDGIVAVATSFSKYEYRYKEVCLITLCTSVLPALLTLLLLRVVRGRFMVRVYSLLLISILIAAYSLIKICRLKGKINKCSKALVKTAIPILPSSVSTALSGQADKLFITRLMGAFALAKYSVIHSLGVGLNFIVSAVGFALSPWITRKLRAKDYDAISLTVSILISVLSSLCIFLMALAPEAMRILAPREYLDAYPALLPIVLTTPLSLLSSVNSICLVNEGRAKETLMISVGGTAVGLILNFMLIGKIGYLGAGLSMLASQATTALSGLFVIFRSRLGRVIDLKKITEAVLTALTIGAVAYFLFESPALRVLLLIPPTIALLNVFFGFHRLFIE
jgi:O-antigen/teichoic acid export membrane protein